MDITTTSTIGEELPKNQYVSCIKVDRVPILPPLMTEERRIEMRKYKELALLKEKELREKRARRRTHTISTENQTFVREGKEADCYQEGLNRSLSSLPSPDDPVTSTPRVPRTKSVLGGQADDQKRISATSLNFEEKENKSPSEEKSSDPQPLQVSATANRSVLNVSDVPKGVLQEIKIITPPEELNKSQSTTTMTDPSERSSSPVSYDAEEKVEAGNESSGDEENFESAASSAGTFVIRRSDETENKTVVADNSGRASKVSSGNTFTTSEDEGENENAPPTVIRKSCDEPFFSKRKRPAKFFDDDVKDEGGTPRTSSSTAYSYLPNSIPIDDEGKDEARKSGSRMSFSPVPHTNFTSIAKSLTNEFARKVSATLGSSSSSYLVTSGRHTTADSVATISKRETEVKEFDTISNSSDKENINTLLLEDSKKQVRKLSYTLATPSAVLLEAASKDKNFVRTLDTVPSEAGSVGQPTPVKHNCSTNYNSNNKPSTVKSLFKDTAATSANDPGLTSALENLNLGHGKQAHLERFLGDQQDGQVKRVLSFSSPTSNAPAEDPIQSILQRMEEEQTRKLKELAEQHRKQELLIRQQFESEMEKLKEKLNSTLNTTNSSKSHKTSPNSVIDSVNSSARSPPSKQVASGNAGSRTFSPDDITLNTENSSKQVTSGMSGISFSEQTRSGGSGVYHFRGDSTNISSSNTKATTTGVVSELAGVGLSKLHSRMLMMSPSLFRTPTDAKSPLLKGLVFPDPLDKPRPPLRIPPKALDPAMKPKFDRMSALVKGFLIRRVLSTEKVQVIVQTIRDTVDLLMKLYEEVPMIMIENGPGVKPQDYELQQRLIQQLNGACRSFYDVFFKLTTKERMAIIATDREKLKAKAMRLMNSPGRPAISNATLKSIERRMSHRSSPKRDNRRTRNSTYHTAMFGSMSVKPKPVKSFNISPKRRRISYWDDKNTTRSVSSSIGLGKTDLNGNSSSSLKTPISSSRSYTSTTSASASARSARSSSAAALGDTFIVPLSSAPKSAVSSYSLTNSARTLSGRRDSTCSNPGKAISARSTQSSISVSSSVGNRPSRTSMSRQKPWK